MQAPKKMHILLERSAGWSRPKNFEDERKWKLEMLNRALAKHQSQAPPQAPEPNARGQLMVLTVTSK
jgi:hypothetical protein